MALDLSQVQHHPALEEMVDVLCNKTQNLDRGFFRAEVAYMLGKMASSMRATVVTRDRGDIPVNIYVLALAASGFGKGYSLSIVEEEFLKTFKLRFMEDTFPVISEQNLWVVANKRAARNSTGQQEEYDIAKKEFDQVGPFPFTFDSATVPAVKQLRHKMLLATAGSINLQIDEIGSNLIGATEVLTLFLELYDQGLVKDKLVKNTNDNKRVQVVDGKTPTNMMLFGTPAKLLDGGTTEDQFYSFLEIGYARRCIFGYGVHTRASNQLTPEQVYDLLVAPQNLAAIAKWQQHFYQLADPAMFGWRMEMNDQVSIQLLTYRIDCEQAAEVMPEHDDIRKAELSHRYFKALKLAGIYAFIDGSTEVEMNHLLSAIKLIEESGKAFQTILSREKAYAKLAKYIAGVGEEVTYADLDEALPFFKSGKAAREEQMTMAIAWGYKKHIIIKRSFADNIEFFKGEMLKETNLKELIVSYSDNFAYGFRDDKVPFDQFHVLVQAEGYHWANHHFKDFHRNADNVIPGFNMIVLDVDAGTSLEMAHALMADFKFLTYTTKRHTEEKNRFRMILPINYTLFLDNDEYKEFMQGIFAWLPFKTDESYMKREKKSESFSGGAIAFNNEGHLFDVLNFIPKTTRNAQHKKDSQQLGSLDNLERWFAGRIATGNRNNQMIKYALCLVDSGWDLHSVRNQVYNFNSKLPEPMTIQEIDSTILVTVAKRYQQP